MNDPDPQRLKALIERLGRLVAAEQWAADLNPSQAAALGYLARANRFSRAPSQVADYLGATRGTVSQTLIALERKGLVAVEASPRDRRSLAYALTDTGRSALAETALERVLEAMADTKALEAGLRAVLAGLLAARGGRAFGICRACQHYEPKDDSGYCRLLSEPLLPEEAEQICHEQVARRA
jgi:DNA-binding MarR family transcriptional regulator